MCVCVCVFKNRYTVRLLLMQHDKNDEDTKSSSTVNDGCLVLAIGAAVGAAALLTVTVIVATALRICHRQPSFANKRVSQANEVIPFS